MGHIKLVVDGEILLDDELNTWTDRASPSFVRELLQPKPGTKPQVHLMAAGLVLSQLALADQSATITVATGDADRWSLGVDPA